ncbi:MAG: hypothetical protein ACPH55_00515 [Luminiphilus sp.]
MTQTKTIQRININKIGNEYFLAVTERITVDDPDDDQLPIHRDNERRISRNVATIDSDGNETINPRDLSGEDQVIQDVAAAIWPTE